MSTPRERYLRSLSRSLAMGAASPNGQRVEGAQQLSGQSEGASQPYGAVAVKDVVGHHRANEEIHRKAFEKFKGSEFPGARELALEHQKKWHGHAKLRTHYENLDRKGKTHVARAEYRKHAKQCCGLNVPMAAPSGQMSTPPAASGGNVAASHGKQLFIWGLKDAAMSQAVSTLSGLGIKASMVGSAVKIQGALSARQKAQLKIIAKELRGEIKMSGESMTLSVDA